MDIESATSNEPIVTPANWQKWCRLCGKSDLGDSSIKYESFGNLTFIIQKHFSISLSETDSATVNSICIECHEFILKLERFTEHCIKVDLLFNKILSSNENLQVDINYLQALRYEAGLDKDEKTLNLKSFKQDKTTDTDDLIIVECSVELKQENDSQKFPKITKKPRKRKNIKTADDEEAIEEEIEIEAAFDYDNDDYENDPTFGMDSDQNVLEDDDINENTNGEENELININEFKELRSQRKKRRRKQLSEEISLKCPLCEINFENKRLYDSHMKENHPKSENPFACLKCPKRFPTFKKLIRHETVHLPDELKLVHPCQFCDKRFSKLVNVQAHIRAIHTGDRPFICEECGKSFVAKGALKEHQIIHSDEFPFQCSHCPKKFKNMARLRTHEDIHKHTAYICPHCGLQLNTKRTLKMHMVVHSDQKKYKCQYCGNDYKRSKALKNHLILHTGLRPYTCPWCEKTFANGSNCRSHKKKAHPIELAALEASGEQLPAANIPKLEHLQPKKPQTSESTAILVITQADNKIIEDIVYTQNSM